MSDCTRVVFDLETVPDYELISRANDIEYDESAPWKTGEIYKKRLLESGKSDFPKTMYHHIVSMGVTMLRPDYSIIDTRAVTVGLKNSNDEIINEEMIIDKFRNLVDSSRRQIIGFNSKSFDLQTLCNRAMKHGIPLKAIFDTSGQNKYDGYLNRYQNKIHLDLCEVISNFNFTNKLSLSDLGHLCGFRSKDEVDGSAVEQIFLSGKDEDLRKIDDYVQRDCIATTRLLYSYLLLSGEINKDHFFSLISHKCFDYLDDQFNKE